jgi:hypothetical protein
MDGQSFEANGVYRRVQTCGRMGGKRKIQQRRQDVEIGVEEGISSRSADLQLHWRALGLQMNQRGRLLLLHQAMGTHLLARGDESPCV